MSKEVDNTTDENNNESPEDRYVCGFDIEAALGNAERERPIARNIDQSDRIPNTNNDSTSGNDDATTSISEDGTQSQQPNVSPEAAPDASIDDVTTDATQDRAAEADARATTNTTEKYPNGIWADQPHEAEPNDQRQTDARRSPQGDTPATSAAEKPQQGADEGRGSDTDTTAVVNTNAKRGQDRPGEQPTETQMQTRSTDTPETTTEGEFTTTSSSVVDASVLRDDADTDLAKKDVGTDIEPVQTTPSRGDDESINDFIDRIDSSQEYIKITPVRCEINEETVARELYGLHEYGKGQKLPLDIEKHISLIDSAASFEFLIHKPADSTQFEFYIGPGKTGDVTCDRLQSSVRAQYPEDYSFEREQFDPSNSFDKVPHMVRFNGSEKKRRDWMTRLVGLEDNDIERSPLANLLETAAQCDGEVLYQVLFEPRADWNRKASTQKMLLKRNVSSMPGLFAQSALDAIVGVSSQEKSERHRGNTPNQVGGSIHDTESSGLRPGTDRMSQIDLKDPANTYNTCIRVASTSEKTAKHITDSLNHLSGFFYRVKGKHLGRDEAEFSKMLDHELTYPRTITAWGTEKPILVTNTEELANFITVPPINHLPKASKAASGGKPASQAPITSPNEKVYQRFSDGMAIGKAVTELNDSRDDLPTSTISDIPAKNEWWDEVTRRESLHVPSDLLTIHYARLATTGSGKSVAELNDMLTAYNNFSGPVILIEPSG